MNRKNSIKKQNYNIDNHVKQIVYYVLNCTQICTHYVCQQTYQTVGDQVLERTSNGQRSNSVQLHSLCLIDLPHVLVYSIHE